MSDENTAEYKHVTSQQACLLTSKTNVKRQLHVHVHVSDEESRHITHVGT